MPALALLEGVGIEAIHAHDLALAARLRDGLGLAPGDSAIVSVGGLPEDAADRLAAAGVMAAGRGGALRLSCHLYTTDDDVDRALAALPAGRARAEGRRARSRRVVGEAELLHHAP